MWIVRLALRRPYTTACLAIIMMLFGAFAATSMPTDIFPSTNIPIVSVVWSYNGLPARDMEGRMVTLSERAFTTGVADIEHIESESLDGIAIIRVYIQPSGDLAAAVAQIAGTCQAILRQMPPGTTPPYIIRYSATDVPVMEVGIGSTTLGEQELNDIGNQFIRPQLVHDASVYARSSGYVRGWYADLGAHVSEGQLLAVIDAPDLDQQLSQAKSTEAQAQAQLVLAKSEATRWQQLVKDSVVTQDDYDQKQSAYQSQLANVQASHDNVRRLEALVGYERITAPFAGVVTARNIDNGSYITASGQAGAPVPAGATGAPTELFHVARTDTMRVYIGVPQAYAPAVHPNLLADLEVQELPNRLFPGKIVRTADAVDLASRTLLTEVDVANRGGVLLPGMYADIHFTFDRPSPPILMPGTALIFRTQGAQAAVIGSDSVAHFHSLRIGRDYGTVMEVVSGLDEGDLVVNQPSDALRDGQRVRARLAPDRTKAGSNDQRRGQQVQVLEGFPNSPSP